MTRKHLSKDFKTDVRFLKKRLPALLPVRVYRRKLTDCLGYTELKYVDGKAHHFVIAVESRMSWDATWQVLIHEWAHAVSWTHGHETVCDHGPEWALALARVYQESVAP